MNRYKSVIKEAVSSQPPSPQVLANSKMVSKEIDVFVRKLMDKYSVGEFELDVYAVIMAHAILLKGYSLKDLTDACQTEIMMNRELYK